MSLLEHAHPFVKGRAIPAVDVGLGSGRLWKVRYVQDDTRFGVLFSASPFLDDDALALIRELQDSVGVEVQYIHSDQAPDEIPTEKVIPMIDLDGSPIDVPVMFSRVSYQSLPGAES